MLVKVPLNAAVISTCLVIIILLLRSTCRGELFVLLGSYRFIFISFWLWLFGWHLFTANAVFILSFYSFFQVIILVISFWFFLFIVLRYGYWQFQNFWLDLIILIVLVYTVYLSQVCIFRSVVSLIILLLSFRVVFDDRKSLERWVYFQDWLLKKDRQFELPNHFSFLLIFLLALMFLQVLQVELLIDFFIFLAWIEVMMMRSDFD